MARPKDKIKILFLIDYLHGFGGTERHVFQLAMCLDRDRFECIVSPFSSNEYITNIFSKAGIRVVPAPVKRIYGLSGLKQAGRLYRFIQENDIDIVQTFNRDSDILGSLVAKLAGTRVIVSSRRDLGAYRQKRHLTAAKFTNRFVDHFIAVCDAVGETLIEQEQIARERVTTIYNGFDLTAVSNIAQGNVEQLGKKVAVDKHNFVVGNVSHFRPEKGHNVFFEAMRNVKCEIPELRVLAVGAGEPLLSRFKSEIAQNGLSEFVVLTGYAPNVLEYVSLMDVCCLTPISNEGFSNALLEQMALRKAIVATDVGGNREAISHGESGLIIPANDPDALSDAVLRLYKDKRLRQSMGAKARKRVETIFSLQNMIDKMEKFYFELYQQKTNGELN